VFKGDTGKSSVEKKDFTKFIENDGRIFIKVHDEKFTSELDLKISVRTIFGECKLLYSDISNRYDIFESLDELSLFLELDNFVDITKDFILYNNELSRILNAC
jgi:hypothetical protein